MTTVYKTIEEIINGEKCPFPIDTLPNNMGINLCSVEGIAWQKQDDGQLTNITIYFIPAK
jgi:hypothetical protein